MDELMKFGDWTVIEDYYVMIPGGKKTYKRKSAYICQCKCALIKLVSTSSLRRGQSLQCASCANSINRTKHGHCQNNSKRTLEYRSWSGARTRCNNNKSNNFYLYGGRGIRMCERWSKFENFIEDMGTRPGVQYHLDRIDPDGNYELGNCRWVTREENQANRRNSAKYRGQYFIIHKDKLCSYCLPKTDK